MPDTTNETDLARHSAPNAGSGGLAPQADTLKVVFCPVCRAVYLPSSPQQEITRSSFTLLEAAFLHVCHFCFRCQRPACPQCWSQKYNLCAACGEAAHLPFRSPLASFEGLIFSPPALPQMTSGEKVSFTCLRNGRFYASKPPKITPEDSTARPPVGRNTRTTSIADYPDWLQEVMGRKPDGEGVGDVQRTEESVGGSTCAENAPALSQSLEPEQSSQIVVPWLEEPIEVERGIVAETNLQEVLRVRKGLPLVGWIENILILITSLVLATIIIMIVLAVSSANINALFFRFIHIDIRAEIAYILQLILGRR